MFVIVIIYFIVIIDYIFVYDMISIINTNKSILVIGNNKFIRKYSLVYISIHFSKRRSPEYQLEVALFDENIPDFWRKRGSEHLTALTPTFPVEILQWLILTPVTYHKITIDKIGIG
jgi:hypothetical protein